MTLNSGLLPDLLKVMQVQAKNSMSSLMLCIWLLIACISEADNGAADAGAMVGGVGADVDGVDVNGVNVDGVDVDGVDVAAMTYLDVVNAVAAVKA